MSVTKKTHAVVPGAVFDFVKGVAIPEQHLPYTSLSCDSSSVAPYAVVGKEKKMKIIKQVPDCKVTSVLRAELRSLGNLELLAPRTELRLHEDKDKDEDDGQQDAEHNECIVPPKTLFQRQLLWSSSRWPGLQAEVNEKLASEDSNNEFLAFDFPQVTVTAVSPPTPPGKNCFLILAFTHISFTLNSCASESGSDAFGAKVWR